MALQAVIKGTGSYLPTRIVPNSYFHQHEFYDEKGIRLPHKNEIITQKFEDITEIKERRFATDDLLTSDIALIAAQEAIKDAQIDLESLDYIFVAHNFGDAIASNGQIDIMPSLATRVKNKLGIKNPKCIPYDMLFGCPGWVQAMILAQQLGQAGALKRALVIGADILSRISDPHDRTAMIFADGAGAVIIEMEESKKGIIAYDTRCDTGEEYNYIISGKSVNPNYTANEVMIQMKGRKVYEYVLNSVPQAIKNCIEQAGLHFNDIDKILIHQANAKMDYAILERLVALYGLEGDFHHKMPMTIQNFGNSSVATIPTMLDLIMKSSFEPHEINEGDTIIFASVGAGMNINAIIYKV